MNELAVVNRLADQSSPYLLQHAHNPVAWQPWDQHALDLSVDLDKPILLSIGYAACHWCHVMERESFENENIAALMNDLYVCIKVDREERPDLDKVYQLAHQMMSRRPGGWPLTVFLTPQGHAPLFAGTYFPPQPRHGMPAFSDVLKRVAAHYREHKDALVEHDQAFRDAMAQTDATRHDGDQPASLPTVDVIAQAVEGLIQSHDDTYGGFGGAPKFPNPPHVELLLRYAETDARAKAAVTLTLTRMADGGLADHLRGGFYRYCVDAEWQVPHFEKMLYDNAQLLPLYADASLLPGLLGGSDLADADHGNGFAKTAAASARWVMAEMQAEDGGYYATLDADSEGEEGKFYVWQRDEVRQHLGAELWAVAERYFNFSAPANFEGAWHLARGQSVKAIANELAIDADDVRRLADAAREQLLALRARRVRPGLDDKILTAWNGLMIGGMAHAGRVLNEPAWIASAERAFDFVRRTLWSNGRFKATTRQGKTHLNAYLDDYAYMLDGGLALLQARWRDGDLSFLIEIADALLTYFEDREHGGFFFTSHDHETLLQRPKPGLDDAIPAGNGIAAAALLQLGHLIGETRFVDAAENTLRAFAQAITNMPAAHGSLLFALDAYLDPGETVVIRGQPEAIRTWAEFASQSYAPKRLVIAIPDDAESLPDLLAQRRAGDGPVAYLCRGVSCDAPITDWRTFEAKLR